MITSNIDFEQLKQRILPYFIEIYGEEFSEIIVSKMNSIEPIFYSTIDSKKSEMHRMQSTKRIELTLKFLEHNNIIIPDEIKDKIIKGNSSYSLIEFPEANNLLQACFETREYYDMVFGGIKTIPQQPVDSESIKIKSVATLEKLGISVSVQDFNNWVSTEEAKAVFERIESLKNYISLLDSEYKNFDTQFDKLKSLIDKSNEIERNTREKHMIEFLSSIEKYLTEHDKQLLNQYVNSEKKDWYSFKRETDIFKVVGDSFYTNGLIESFGSKADEKLNNPQSTKFCKQNIIEGRIKYYKLIGLYKEQLPPEEFILTREAISNSPKQDFMDDIILKKEHFAKLADEEILSITSSYEDNMDKINSLNLVDKPDFKIDNIKKGIISISPSARMVNGNIESVAVLCFSPETCLPEYIDTSFIHEVNHAIELSLVNYSKETGNFQYKCGFEFLDNSDEPVREYEGFSEVVNQVIAMEITEAMHRDGVYLFDNPNTSKIKGGISYEQQRNFIEIFWKKFKKEIMFARVNNNLDSLFDVVGKENFNNLNNIINEYSNLPYYEMMNDVINNRTTQLTEKRVELSKNALETCDMMIENAKRMPGYENIEGRNL